MKKTKNSLIFFGVRFRVFDLFRISDFGFRYFSKGGQAIILAGILFLAISLTVGLGVAQPVVSQVESVRALARGADSLYAAEGVSQDVVYRVMKGVSVDAVENLTVGTAVGIATTTSVLGGKEVVSAGNSDRYVRKNKTKITTGDGASFNYGMQSGAGGIVLENSSSVSGNVYTNGSVDGAGSNLIKGSVVSAGPSGLVDGIHATSSAFAHTIQNSTVDGDAYYVTKVNTTVSGASHPGSPDQATSSLPIADSLIADWESDANTGGTISSPCPYTISGNVTLGPKKINCDLEISGSPTITLTGALWVAGNITVKNSPTIKVSASLGAVSVPIIADKTSNQTTSSKISLENSATFDGSGSAGSYVLMISQNKSAETGGAEKAIDAKNSVNGKLLVYAGHGEILLENSIKVKEVTAWRIRLQNSAQVIYETGLANLLFTSGPSGGYSLDTWREVE